MSNLSTPLGACQVHVPTDPPSTPHQAYVAGWDASRRGVDLATVVFDAILRWPLGDVHELAELITCASLGYWTEGGRS